MEIKNLKTENEVKNYFIDISQKYLKGDITPEEYATLNNQLLYSHINIIEISIIDVNLINLIDAASDLEYQTNFETELKQFLKSNN